MISSLAAAGVFVAVPVVGRHVLGRLPSSVPALARPSLWICAGLAVWSLPLLASLILGVYHAEIIGLAGWILVALYVPKRRPTLPRWRRLSRPDKAVLAGVVLAAALAAAHPADPFATGRDMGVYANHAVYMVNHGRLDVPYLWDAAGSVPRGFLPFPGLYPTQPTMTVEFGHLYPAWLAQTFAVAGYDGLVRLNVLLGVVSLLAVYGLARRFVSPPIAALAIVFLAFNAAQFWTASTTLSEIATQLFIWGGLLFLTAYLARGSPRVGIWAGVFLGLSALIRIDGFLLVPLLLLAHGVWNILRPHASHVPARAWGYVYVGAAPLFALAIAYYVLFSRPYLLQQRSQLLALLGLTVASAGLLALSRLPAARRLANVALSRRPVALGLFGGLALVTAYAYFVRPEVPPFDTFRIPGSPLDGQRSRIEDALPNLGRYLTPPVVWAALLGWSVMVLAAMRRWRATALVPFLILSLGCTAVYVWNQSISPDHYWAVRRFIPVIVPALVVLAGAAATLALRRLTPHGRTLAFGLSVAWLLGYTALNASPTYTVEDRRGSYAFLTEFARTLPASGLVLGLGDSYETANWWMPLYLAFDRPILPLDITASDGIAEALERLRGASEAEPMLIVTARGAEADALEGLRTSVARLSRPVIDATVMPIPKATHVEDVTLTTILVTGLDTVSVEFGAQSSWLAPESGFHHLNTSDGRPGRWTNGHGRLSIPIEGSSPPARLGISITDTGPEGAELLIMINGISLFEGTVPAGPWAAEYELPGLADPSKGTVADIEIISSTFLPNPGSGDEAVVPYGVQLRSVALLDAE